MWGLLTCSLAAMARSVLRLRLSVNLPVGLLMLSAGYSSRRSVSVSAWSHGSEISCMGWSRKYHTLRGCVG